MKGLWILQGVNARSYAICTLKSVFFLCKEEPALGLNSISARNALVHNYF